MRAATVFVACLGLWVGLGSVAAQPGPKTEKRCGYLANPTPANWWLNDRDGEWLISAQGGYQAEGLDVLPESFFQRGWVRTNGYYGYRCACLNVTVDRKEMRINRIYSGQPLPMARCTRDKALRQDD
jgi:Protein of unknown function (DUF4087)